MCLCLSPTYQWGSLVFPDIWSWSCRIHVAEESIELPEGNTATSITHLQRDRERKSTNKTLLSNIQFPLLTNESITADQPRDWACQYRVSI